MKRIATRILILCLALALLPAAAAAEALTEPVYTIAEKMLKQLEMGSGFTGTLTVESVAVPGREGEAYTTLKPVTLDGTFIYVREDLAAKKPAESRVTLALVEGDKQQATAELAMRSGALYLRASLAGEGWYTVGSDMLAANASAGALAADGTAGTSACQGGAMAEAAQGLLSGAAMPGAAAFARGISSQLRTVDTAKLATLLDTYTTKIDLWIEGYRQNTQLGKGQDGATTMQIDYQIPAAAVKAQLKQLLIDLLADTELTALLAKALPDGWAERYLDPAMQAYYFYAVDQLPLAGEMAIHRTLSLRGDTLALSLALPYYDSQGGACTLRYDRAKGTGDLLDENTVVLESQALLLRLSYQSYETLTGATVYQGTLLRQPLGAQTYEVTADADTESAGGKALSTAFTFSLRQATATDAEGMQTQSIDAELRLTPDYTPEEAGDEPVAPTAEQATQYMVFEPLDFALTAAFSSGQAKNASTAFTCTITCAGDTLPQVVTLAFSGKTRGKWTPDTLDTTAATALNGMDAAALSALLAQTGIRGGLVLLPYLGLPTAATPTPAPQPSSAP